jgi:Ca-activated chloride channel family protein
VRTVFARLAALLGALALSGCGGGSGASSGRTASAPESQTLHCIAGSELKDLEPQLADLQAKTGVAVQLEYSGTLAGIERINAGEQFDCAWFSHAKYLVESDTKHRIRAQERIMLSPVVLGVKESSAKRLGWLGTPNLTWKQIAQAAADGKLRYAMTNPTTSNSGFTATIGVVSALLGTSDALKPSQVQNAELTGFFKGQALTAGSSGWLVDAYLRDQSRLDGIINYESTLLELNAGAGAGVKPDEPLVLIYPKEGIITADYPLILLNEDKRALYQKAVDYLKSADVQNAIVTQTYRRPVNPDVPLPAVFPKTLLVELPFPGNIATIDAILLRYLNENRIPPHSYYVLDISGSMQGRRIGEVQQAMHILAGGDPSLGGQFARFANREKITIVPFSGIVHEPATFEMHGRNDAATEKEVAAFVDGLNPDGSTAIFGAIETAEDLAYQSMRHDSSHYYTIVLMTDGENNREPNLTSFIARYQSLPQAERNVRVFPIIFGEASPGELKKLAEVTGGRLFDGRKESLADIFREIRGYQ